MALATLAAMIALGGGSAHAQDAGNASNVTFSPADLRLDNPRTQGGTTTPAALTIEVKAHDASGQPMTPSPEHPLTVEVHGAPQGTIEPRTTKLTAPGPLTLAYDGSYFANPITIVAWMDRPGGDAFSFDGAASGSPKALGRTQILPRNHVDCSYGSRSFELPVLCDDRDGADTCAIGAIRHGLRVRAAIGHADPTDRWLTFAIDTGSIGTVVPVEALGPDAMGPGAPGRVYYDSSGNIFSGNYYLASVALAIDDGRYVRTPPMKVLAISSASCAPDHPSCDRHPPRPTLHYLGVGFARGKSEPTGFVSPADNAFLQVASSERDVSPGYILTGRAITVGIAGTDRYRLSKLAPSSTAAGDWSAAQGCFAFPDVDGGPRFCGSFLLDVGLTQMYLDLPTDQRPADAAVVERCRGAVADVRCTYVPDETRMRVTVGDPDRPALSYGFTLEREPRGPAPLFAQWIDREQVFINTGRRPLFDFHYLFDARCGNVGFASVD